MNLKRSGLLLLVFGILSFQLSGCATRLGVVVPGPQIITTNQGVKITLNNFSKEESEMVIKALDCVPKRVQESVVKINAGC
ncbi:MAG: hypothetical protein AAB646_01910, partial [Patescibacteria group bacterium]